MNTDMMRDLKSRINEAWFHGTVLYFTRYNLMLCLVSERPLCLICPNVPSRFGAILVTSQTQALLYVVYYLVSLLHKDPNVYPCCYC